MSSMRELVSLCLKAWSSKHAIKLFPVLLLVGFSVVTPPLIEGPGNAGLLIELLLPSALSAVPAAAVLYLLWFATFRKGDQPAWMLFVISSLAGLVRGISLYIAGETLADPSLDLPTLESRILVAVVAWNLTLLSFAVVNYLVITPTEKLYQLRRDLLGLDEEIQDSKLQLEWLVNRKVRGLEQELRDEFLALSKSMRDGSAASYQELAQALRRFASESVRNRSREIWEDHKPPSPLSKAAISAVVENPLVPASVSTYLLGYLVNEIRIYGFGFGLLAVLLGSLSYLLLVLAARSLGLAVGKNLWVVLSLSVLQGLISGILFLALLPERGESYAITTGIVATLWAFASLFISGWLTISIRLYAAELEVLDERREISESELLWLESQLKSTNREISKYLHGILQSRLMAHALSMEGRGDRPGADLDQVLDDLEQIMARPMDSFFEVRKSLSAELERVTERWQGFIEIKIEKLEILDNGSNDATLQILQEALSNASRHGGATLAEISVADLHQVRKIAVRDNGNYKPGTPSGLGTEIVSSLTQGNWSITRVGVWTVFEATIPNKQ